jgi:hypothetical protein
MKMEFRVIVDQPRNGEASIRDELTVCRWEEARIGGNCKMIKQYLYLSSISGLQWTRSSYCFYRIIV